MPQKPEYDSGFAKSFREVGPYLGLGLQLAITIVAMVFLGSWLDKKFQTGYLFTLIGGFIGISAGIYNLIKTVDDIEKKNKNAQKK